MAENGTASKTGIAFGVSNGVIAILGTVALVGIGAHLLSEWLRPRHAIEVSSKTDEPTIMEAMYGEAVASATHPEQIYRNQDRVHAAIKQRIPRMQELARRAKDGQIGPDKVAEGIHNNARDVLDQLEIPSQPHPSAAPPHLVELFKNQRKDNLTDRYNVPGGLVLDPYERRWLEHQAMSYAVTTDPVDRVVRRDAARDASEAARLAAIRMNFAERQHLIASKHLEQAQDIRARQLGRASRSLNLPRLGIA